MGKLQFQMSQDPDCAAAVLFRVPVWPSGVSLRRDPAANASEMSTAGRIGAILESGLPDGCASVARSRRPIGEMEWTTADTARIWAPADIDWYIPQLLVLPAL